MAGAQGRGFQHSDLRLHRRRNPNADGWPWHSSINATMVIIVTNTFHTILLVSSSTHDIAGELKHTRYSTGSGSCTGELGHCNKTVLVRVLVGWSVVCRLKTKFQPSKYNFSQVNGLVLDCCFLGILRISIGRLVGQLAVGRKATFG